MISGNRLGGSFLAAKHVATRNVLAPLLWLSAILTPTSLLAAKFETGIVAAILLIAALSPPALALVAYGYWTFKEPNRLQSEEFVLQQRWMDGGGQIGDNQTGETIEVPKGQARLGANTAHREEA